MWFNIKQKWTLEHGSSHFLQMIRLSRTILSVKHYTQVVLSVLKHSVYYANTECALLGVMADTDISLRLKGIAAIQKSVIGPKSLSRAVRRSGPRARFGRPLLYHYLYPQPFFLTIHLLPNLFNPHLPLSFDHHPSHLFNPHLCNPHLFNPHLPH